MTFLFLVFVNSSTINIAINETTANGTGILNLTVTDTDFDTVLDFGILSGNTKNVFAFNLLSDNLGDPSRTQYQATGQLSVVGPLSYEDVQNYSLVLFAFDTQNRAPITVNVNLIPQNTKAPIFVLNPGFSAYEYVVTEGTPIPVLIGPSVSAMIDRSSCEIFVTLDSSHRSRYSSGVIGVQYRHSGQSVEFK